MAGSCMMLTRIARWTCGDVWIMPLLVVLSLFVASSQAANLDIIARAGLTTNSPIAAAAASAAAEAALGIDSNSNSKIQVLSVSPKTTAASSIPSSTIVKLSPVSSKSEHKHSNKKISVNDRLHKFDLFVDPICEQLGKLSEKQLSKAHSQLRQFSHLTNNSLARCLLDSGLKLDLIAASQAHGRDHFGAFCLAREAHNEAYKQFVTCAARHWLNSIDAEIDRILKERMNAAKRSNSLSKASGLASGEPSLIDDIVALLHEEQSQEIASELASQQQTLAAITSTTAKPPVSGAHQNAANNLGKHTLTIIPTTSSGTGNVHDAASVGRLSTDLKNDFISPVSVASAPRTITIQLANPTSSPQIKLATTPTTKASDANQAIGMRTSTPAPMLPALDLLVESINKKPQKQSQTTTKAPFNITIIDKNSNILGTASGQLKVNGDGQAALSISKPVGSTVAPIIIVPANFAPTSQRPTELRLDASFGINSTNHNQDTKIINNTNTINIINTNSNNKQLTLASSINQALATAVSAPPVAPGQQVAPDLTPIPTPAPAPTISPLGRVLLDSISLTSTQKPFGQTIAAVPSSVATAALGIVNKQSSSAQPAAAAAATTVVANDATLNNIAPQATRPTTSNPIVSTGAANDLGPSDVSAGNNLPDNSIQKGNLGTNVINTLTSVAGSLATSSNLANELPVLPIQTTATTATSVATDATRIPSSGFATLPDQSSTVAAIVPPASVASQPAAASAAAAVAQPVLSNLGSSADLSSSSSTTNSAASFNNNINAQSTAVSTPASVAPVAVANTITSDGRSSTGLDTLNVDNSQPPVVVPVSNNPPTAPVTASVQLMSTGADVAQSAASAAASLPQPPSPASAVDPTVMKNVNQVLKAIAGSELKNGTTTNKNAHGSTTISVTIENNPAKTATTTTTLRPTVVLASAQAPVNNLTIGENAIVPKSAIVIQASHSTTTTQTPEAASTSDSFKPTSTTTVKPNDELSLLKGQDEASGHQVHDVIVVGEHVDGDDQAHDHEDQHSSSSGNSKAAESHEDHHDEGPKITHSIVDAALTDSVKQQDGHADHEHLLEGLMAGDVLHVEAGERDKGSD